MYPRRRIGTIRAQLADHMYTITTTNGVISAYAFGTSIIPIGRKVNVIYHPEMKYWVVEPIESRLFIPSIVWENNTSIATETGLVNVSNVVNPVAGNDGGSAIASNHVVALPDGKMFFARRTTLYRSIDFGETWNTDLPTLTWNVSGIRTSDMIYERWYNPSGPNYIHLFVNIDVGARGYRYARYDIDRGVLEKIDIDGVWTLTDTTSGGGPWESGWAAISSSGKLYTWAPYLSNTNNGFSDDHGDTWVSDSFAEPPSMGGFNNVNIGGYGLPDMSTGDPDDIQVIRAVYYSPNPGGFVTLDSIRYDRSANTWSTVLISQIGEIDISVGTANIFFGSVTLNLGYSAVLSSYDNHIKIFARDNHLGNIRCWDLYGTSVEEKTNVDTDTEGTLGQGTLSSSVDDNGRIYCYYLKDVDGFDVLSLEVVGRYSDDNMVTWQDMDPYIRSASTDVGYIPKVHADPRTWSYN